MPTRPSGANRAFALPLILVCATIMSPFAGTPLQAQDGCVLRYQYARSDGTARATNLQLVPGATEQVNRVDLQRVTNRGSRELRVHITMPVGGTKWVSVREGRHDPPIGNYIGSVTLIAAQCMHLYESPVAMYTALVRADGGYTAAEKTIDEFGLAPAAFLSELQGHLELYQVGMILRNNYEMTAPSIAAALEGAGYPVEDATVALREVLEAEPGPLPLRRWPPVLRQAYGDADAARATLARDPGGRYDNLVQALYLGGFTLGEILSALEEMHPRVWEGQVAARVLWTSSGQTDLYSRGDLARALADHFRADGRQVASWLVVGMNQPLLDPSALARQPSSRVVTEGRTTRNRNARDGTARRAQTPASRTVRDSRRAAASGGDRPGGPAINQELGYGLVAEALEALTADAVLTFLWLEAAGLDLDTARDAVAYSGLELTPYAFAEAMRRANAPVETTWSMLDDPVAGNGWPEFNARGLAGTVPDPVAIRWVTALTRARYAKDVALAELAAQDFELVVKGELAEVLRRGGYAGQEAVAALRGVHPDWSGPLVGSQFDIRIEQTEAHRADVLRGLMNAFEAPRDEAVQWLSGFKSGVVGALHADGLEPIGILTMLAPWERDDWVGEGMAESVTGEVDSVAVWAKAARYSAERAGTLIRNMCQDSYTYNGCGNEAHAEANTRALTAAGYEHRHIRPVILSLYGGKTRDLIDEWLEPMRRRRTGGRS